MKFIYDKTLIVDGVMGRCPHSWKAAGALTGVVFFVFGCLDLAALCGCHTLNVCCLFSDKIPTGKQTRQMLVAQPINNNS